LNAQKWVHLSSACIILFLQVTPAHAQSCASPREALDTAGWKDAAPVQVGVVAQFSTPFGWQGLNQIYPTSIVIEHRWRTLLPWGTSETVEYFDSLPSLSSIANRRPVLYLRASALDASLPIFEGATVRLSRLRPERSGRALSVSRGATTFTQRSVYTSPKDAPLLVRKLSDSVIELQPPNPLENGDYLVSLGVDGSAKFEFSVRCVIDKRSPK
jgi:hypothetical protein